MFISLSRSAFSDYELFCRLVCEAMRETWRKRNMMMMMMMMITSTPARAESDDRRVSPFTRGEKVQDLPEEPSSPSQPKQELVVFHPKVHHLWICGDPMRAPNTQSYNQVPNNSTRLTSVRFNAILETIYTYFGVRMIRNWLV